MPTDPGVIQNIQQPQFENPLDVQNKALTMKALMLRNQEQQQAYSDDQAQRQAFRANTSVDQNGKIVVNKPATIAQLAQTNPQMAMKAQQDFQAQDQQQELARHQIAFDIAKSIPTDPSVSLQDKNTAWANARQKAITAGLPGADQSPQEYPGDTFVQQMQQHTMSQLLTADQMLKGQETDAKIADTKENREARLQQGQQSQQTRGDNKQLQTMQQASSMLESARGNSAAAQAEKDLYAAQKFNTGYNLYGDPNKLNPQQSKLLVSEAGKIATGGVPTVDELRGLSQSTVPSWLASAAQAVTNDTSPANQGAFLKALKDYNDGIAKDAQGVIEDKYGRIIESRKRSLNPNDYASLKDQYLNRFNKGGSQASSAAAPAIPADMSKMSDADLAALYKAHGGQ